MALKVLQDTRHIRVGLNPNFLRMQERPPILRREDRVNNQVGKGLGYPNMITTYLYVLINAIRTPFQGGFLVRAAPRAKALGCSLSALRAIGAGPRKCPNSMRGRPRPRF